MADRDQQQQAADCQCNPQEINGAPRREKRYGQWAGELEGYGDAQWCCLQCHIKEEIHPAQGHAVDDHIAQRLGGHPYAPRAQN
ncbi:hypothetical protein D3C79_956390 [compost metagenome]